MKKAIGYLGLMLFCLGLLCCGEGSQSVFRRVLQDPGLKVPLTMVRLGQLRSTGS